MRRSVMFVMVLAAACTTPSHPGDPGPVTPGVQVQTGREFDLGVGQEVQVQGTSLSVRFIGVSEDSRCAVDVQCVWAGNAIVRLALSATGTTGTEAALNTTLDPKSATFAGYSVRLAGLKPLPRSGTAMPVNSYVATLEIRAL
jgi:hypothetical protein